MIPEILLVILTSLASAMKALPCGGIQNVYVCHPTDPTFFQICIGDTLYTMKCPGGLHFNRRTQTCDWPRNADCRKRYTTTAYPVRQTRRPTFSPAVPPRRHPTRNQDRLRYQEFNYNNQKDTVRVHRLQNDNQQANRNRNQKIDYRNPYLGKNPYRKRFRFKQRHFNPFNSVAVAGGPKDLKPRERNVVEDKYNKASQVDDGNKVYPTDNSTNVVHDDKWSLSHSYPWWAAKTSTPAELLQSNSQKVISTTPRSRLSRFNTRGRKTMNRAAAAGPMNRLSSSLKPLPRQQQKPTHPLTAVKLNDEDSHQRRVKAMHKAVRKTGKCTPEKCKLPDCRCIGSDIPGGLPVTQTPMMVMLTFDDSVNVANFDFFQKLFDGKFRNPNGCGIKGSFFISGDATQYHLVEELYKMGMEISSHSLSHRSPTTWWARAGYDGYVHEIEGMRKRLARQGKIPHDDIKGMRVPFLQVGGDDQFQMLHDYKYLYDSSMVTGHLYQNDKPPVWPFTLDWAPDSKTCSLTPCPQKSYPGLWEVPLIRWYGSNKMACAMPDGCVIGPGRQGTLDYLNNNFNRHYSTNRAPLGIFIHASWFRRKSGNFEGMMDFLQELSRMDDVWVITISQVIDWIKNPVPISQVKNIESWKC